MVTPRPHRRHTHSVERPTRARSEHWSLHLATRRARSARRRDSRRVRFGLGGDAVGVERSLGPYPLLERRSRSRCGHRASVPSSPPDEIGTTRGLELLTLALPHRRLCGDGEAGPVARRRNVVLREATEPSTARRRWRCRARSRPTLRWRRSGLACSDHSGCRSAGRRTASDAPARRCSR